MAHNVLQLQELANFVTEYFRLLQIFLRKVIVNLPDNLPFLVTAVIERLFLVEITILTTYFSSFCWQIPTFTLMFFNFQRFAILRLL